jgi:hypothetical protein
VSKDGNSFSVQYNNRANTPNQRNLQQQQQFPEINLNQVYLQQQNSNNSNSLDGDSDPAKKSYLDDSGSPIELYGEMNQSVSSKN